MCNRVNILHIYITAHPHTIQQFIVCYSVRLKCLAHQGAVMVTDRYESVVKFN